MRDFCMQLVTCLVLIHHANCYVVIKIKTSEIDQNDDDAETEDFEEEDEITRPVAVTRSKTIKTAHPPLINLNYVQSNSSSKQAKTSQPESVSNPIGSTTTAAVEFPNPINSETLNPKRDENLKMQENSNTTPDKMQDLLDKMLKDELSNIRVFASDQNSGQNDAMGAFILGGAAVALLPCILPFLSMLTFSNMMNAIGGQLQQMDLISELQSFAAN